MGLEAYSDKTPATLDELRTRVYFALQRHPICRQVQFEVRSATRTARGANWSVSLRSVEPRALFEASDIIADIQEAYDLRAAA